MNTYQRHVGVLSATLFLAAGACMGPPSHVAPDDVGSLSASLQLTPSTSLHTVNYAISGPNAFSRAGSIDVSHSETISATIGGIPAGGGYNVTITGTATDGVTTCAGSAPFAITAAMTSVVSVKIQCREPPRTGSVSINGTVNVCPVVDAVGANPGEVMVGFSIALSSAAHDSDGRSAALTYSWAATSGMLAGATTANPTLTCTAVGGSTLTLTVSDGDCTDTGTVSVVCSPAPAAPANVRISEVESSGGVPGDWVELINIGGTTADLTGWGFRDNDPTHAIAIIPAGTMLPPGGYVVLNEIVGGVGEFGFGLGGADSAILFNASGAIVDQVDWTTAAAVTYGRCPNGTGTTIVNTVASTKGAANSCPAGGMGGMGGGAGGTGGAAGAGGAAGTTGMAGAAGTTGMAGAAGTTGMAGAPGGGATGTGGGAAPSVRINEVESSGGVPGDWVELINIGATTVDLSGWGFRDNDLTHAIAIIPAGTMIAPGGYVVLNEIVAGAGEFGFGLGGADSAILFNASGAVVDQFDWTTAAAVTYGRCPNGTGTTFVNTVTSTKGAANDCPAGGTGGMGGGAAGTTGMAGTAGGGTGGGAAGAGGTGGTVALLSWPTDDTVVTVDSVNQFTSNLSGLFYQPAAGGDPTVIWAVQNGPSLLHRLVFDGTTWVGTATDGWPAGKLLHYTNGLNAPDSEGVTKAEMNSSAIYVSTERDNNNNSFSRLSILRFDTAAAGTELTATHDWNLTADIGAVGPNLGLEAITWVPDTYLVANGFIDESTLMSYDPSRYPGHGTGIFFVGVEATGAIYGYALDHVTGGFQRVATLSSGQASVMDLSFDRDVGQMWAYCDNTCGNKSTILRVGTGHFQIKGLLDRAPTLPDGNNEGITFAPEAECVGGRKAFFWADDGNTAMHALRRGTITCGLLF